MTSAVFASEHATSAATSPRIGFIMEQDVGHAVQALHLCRELRQRPDVDWRYVPVTFHQPDGLIERLPLPGMLRASWRARREVLAGLRGWQPQVLFWNTQKPAAFCQELLEQRPSVISLDVTPRQYDEIGAEYGHRPDSFKPLAAAKHALNRGIFRLARRLLPATRWTARSLVQDYGVDPRRIEVLPPGTDLSRFKPIASKPSRQDGRLRVLFVGGDFHRKGGDLLLEWFRSSEHVNVEVHLVTREPVPAQPGVHLHCLDYEDTGLVELYQQADVFALPTRAECFGLVLTEAMASGVPCLTCDVGGLSEVVQHGVTGLLTPPGDVRALASAMHLLLSDQDLRERMGRAGREDAEKRFDSRKNVGRVLDVLREVAEEAAASRRVEPR